jgi:hypothetical protein
VADVTDAGLLQIGEIASIVDMSLGVKIPIPDFNGVIIMKAGHKEIIHL